MIPSVPSLEQSQLSSLPTTGTLRSTLTPPNVFTSAPKSGAYNELLTELHNSLAPLVMPLPEGAVQYPNAFNLQWHDPRSMHRVYQIAMSQERDPDALDRTLGGKAWWKQPKGKVGGKYVCFEVWDHTGQYPHLKPNLHGHHMKVVFYMPLREHIRYTLHEISDCMHYNANTGMVTVDSHSLGGAILDLALLKMHNEGHITCHDAHKYHMMWKPIIMEEWKNACKYENVYKAPTVLSDSLERYIMSP